MAFYDFDESQFPISWGRGIAIVTLVISFYTCGGLAAAYHVGSTAHFYGLLAAASWIGVIVALPKKRG